MSEERSQEEITPLVSQIKNIGYYAGLSFGTGYSLVFLGVILIFVEMIFRILQAGFSLATFSTCRLGELLL